ncbi:MAG: lipopolysaccharide biosynthesis protein [Gemmatimonadaceae bacterium]
MSEAPRRTGSSSLRWELFANLAGTGWGAAVQILCIPVYVALLGVERYALIAFATSLLLSLKALDLGLSHTINRELAHRTVSASDAAGTREFVRTVESLYGVLGLLLGVTLAMAAPVIATRWFGASALGTAAVAQAVHLIAVLVAVQWPLSLYQGALLGLRRTAAMNGAAIASATLSGGGALVLLYWGNRSLATYFTWQIVVSGAHTLGVALLVHRALPVTARPARLRLALITEVRTTMLYVGGLTLSMLLLLQADKLLASRWLTLDAYGSYMLGAAIASGLAVLGIPVFATLLPRLSALAARGDRQAMRVEFLRGTQLVTILVFPTMLACALLSRDLLELWTHDAALALAAAPAATALLVGTGVASLLQLTIALQLATRSTRTGTSINVILLLLLIPLGVLAASRGAAGVATVWCALVALGAFGGGALVYRRCLGAGAAHWLAVTIGRPLGAILLVAALARPILIMPLALPLAALRLVLFVGGLSALAAVASGLWQPMLHVIRRPVAPRR